MAIRFAADQSFRQPDDMGFNIDYGAPGILMALLVVFGVAALGIGLYFLIYVVKGAREDVEEAHDASESDPES